MAVDVRIIVTDTPPLITLAAAQSLDYLLYPALPVVIPDAVFHEATQAAGKLGAQEILEWYRAHEDLVRVEPTRTFQDEMILRGLGRGPSRDFGERAAQEIVRTFPLAANERALLLSDDRDVERMVITDPDRLILLTTWDYLCQLEEAQRIQSADAVIETVRRAGRNAPKRDLWGGHDPEIREAVRDVIDRAHRDRDKG